MTDRNEHPDELISASLSGDLTSAERGTLDAHLSGCERCRATLDAFTSERRALAGLPRSQPPADLGARVRAGIESGAGQLPWWRRPSTLVGAVATLATVAAALLLVVVVGNLARGPVGATGSPSPSMTPGSAEPSPSVVASEGPSSTPAATPVPSPSSPSLAGWLTQAWVDAQDPSAGQELQLVDPEGHILNTITVPDGSPVGVPIQAGTSADGAWIAFRLLLDGKGTEVLYALRPETGEVVALGETQPTPFAHRLSWSPDGRYLAYTLVSLDGAADAWVFDAATSEVEQVTAIGDIYVGSFEGQYAGPDGEAGLWVSVAESTPRTYRIDVPVASAPLTEVSPSSPGVSGGVSDGIFLPLISPDSSSVIFWRGQMESSAQGPSTITRGGMLYLATGGGADLNWDGEQLFPSLQIVTSGQGFASAEVVWAADSIGYAVWDAQWTGTPQPEGFPSADRVYFGHTSNSDGIGPQQALDAADLPADGYVVDVMAPDGGHLAITVGYPIAGDLAQPRADLLLVTRNLGDVPDEVVTLGPTDRWTGPAVFGPLITP